MGIPIELTQLNQWMGWSYSAEGQKIPAGKSNDPATWKPFSVVKERSKKAFVFSENDPFCGVDLDDCLDDGILADWAIPIVDKFRGIAFGEISPSGTGLKLITRAKKPNGRCSSGNGVECYDHARFWTITETHFQAGFDVIGDGQSAIDWLHETYLKTEPAKPPKQTPKPIVSTFNARLVAYTDSLEPGVKGDLRNAAFRNAGHLYSIVTDGQRPTMFQVYECLKQWNQRNNPQLRDDELLEAAKNGAKNGTPPPDKIEASFVPEDNSGVDLSFLLREWNDIGKTEDDELAEAMIPDKGLMAQVAAYYRSIAYRESSIMALAVSVSFCETLFGRRVRSSSGLRTNDYNVILAGTGFGKESCESAITNIFQAAGLDEQLVMPPDVQSGNGLMKALSTNPSAVWVCDEFGKLLQAVFDKKGNAHLKGVGTNLLKLYGKSGGVYGGASHSDGIRNRINQPCLTVLGLATPSSVFDYLSPESVSDGLFGRIAWFPVQERPNVKENMRSAECPESLVTLVRLWGNWFPGGDLAAMNPVPVEIACTIEAQKRWDSHAKLINDKMTDESESRAAIWSRVAARSMKLAIVSRLSKLEAPPPSEAVKVELEDIEWGIKLGNWLAGISCGLALEAFGLRPLGKAMNILGQAVIDGPKTRRELTRKFKTVLAGDFHAAAIELGLTIENKGRGKVIYSMKN
jgi:hypothetical protein